MRRVTVALPVRNGGALLAETLAAVRRQVVEAELELVVLDSGSTDDSVAVASAAGARVARVNPASFGHGRTRNQLMEMSGGDVVAFLTQDATPLRPDWLRRLLDGFAAAPDVALVCGPYVPRPNAPPWIRREFADWFGAMSDGAGPRVVRRADLQLRRDGDVVPSALSFHTDANGAVLRSAWERVPFREIAYAEDQQLALDMLAVGYAKAFQPLAPVVHSHSYGGIDEVRRAFDEARALREVYGHVAASSPRAVVGRARAETRRDRTHEAATNGCGGLPSRMVLRAFAYHLARGVGAALGARSDVLPPPARAALSLEGRAGSELPTVA